MPGFELFGAEERAEVQDVLQSGVLMRYGFDGARQGHWKSRELETALAERCRVRHAHVCSSGTSAVLTALAGCGVGAGDEVIVPPFTFVADIEAVLWLGAVPVFAEIDATLCLDPKSVEAHVTPRTKAVLVVHMCGAMARTDALATLCQERGITLIEDVAQALGGSQNGRPLGTFGRAGTFSFDYVKTVTCGEGGAVITNDAELHEVVQAFTDHGHDHLGRDRGADLHPILGLNFRISELHAAVGLAQLRKLDLILDRQRTHKRFLKEGLAQVPKLTFRDLPDPAGDSATFLSFFLPTEDEARSAARALAEAGVDGCFYWYDNNWHYHRQWYHFHELKAPGELAVRKAGWLPHLRDIQVPQSDAIMGRTICMLIKLGWTEDDLRQRLEMMRKVLA
ncbi:MAG: DegT/DnrJ/EryC1/StrS family aminotransferase [Verrucomicrobiales bacterium]|nr:DegT/DnrJ/EryC1/StrS family aminotransferase [Verrucomicrobiales bacterium]